MFRKSFHATEILSFNQFLFFFFLSLINCRSAGACVLTSWPCRNRWAVTEHYFQIPTPCSPQAVQHTGRSSQKGKGSIYHKDILSWSGRRKCLWCIMICYAWMFSVEKITLWGNFIITVIENWFITAVRAYMKHLVLVSAWVLQMCGGCICFHLRPPSSELAWDRGLLP